MRKRRRRKTSEQEPTEKLLDQPNVKQEPIDDLVDQPHVKKEPLDDFIDQPNVKKEPLEDLIGESSIKQEFPEALHIKSEPPPEEGDYVEMTEQSILASCHSSVLEPQVILTEKMS